MNLIKKLFIAFGLAAAAVASVCFYFYKGTNPSWSGIYKKDLQAIHDILKENHPGFYDNDNPGFNTWLATGYQQALSKSGSVISSVDYVDGLQFFVNGFKDNHLRLMYDPATLVSDSSSKACKKGNIPLLAGIKEMGPQQVWVTLPSFYPETSEQEAALNNVIDSIGDYKKYDIVIFDVRGNQGGNSYYGTRILKNLYGEEYCNAAFKKLREKQYVEWRVSQGNIDYLKSLLVTLEQKFGLSEIVTAFSVIVLEMEKNLAAGNPFYRALSESVEAVEFDRSQNPLHARVVVITDGCCASACLDFLDELFALGPVLQVGLPTNVDTNYMECRDEKLPSGYATLHFPIKVFRNGPRESNQAYIPQVVVDDVYDDEKVKKMIDDAIGSF